MIPLLTSLFYPSFSISFVPLTPSLSLPPSLPPSFSPFLSLPAPYQVPCGPNGKGYEFKIPTDLVKSILPALRWGLLFLKVAMATQGK